MNSEANRPESIAAGIDPLEQVPRTGWALAVESLRNLVTDNPMLNESKREQRKLLRSGKTALVVGVVIFCLFYIWIAIASYLSGSDTSQLFCYVELTLLTLWLPASIYNSVSGERERGTWDALMLTRLTAGQIIFGKLIWRGRIILIIGIACLIPICLSRLSYSGREITDGMLVAAQAMLLWWGMLLCSFGLWVSAITKRGITSLTVIAITLIGLLIALPTLYPMFSVIDSLNSTANRNQGALDPVNSALTALNPFTSLTIVLGSSDAGIAPILPGSTVGGLQIGVYLTFSIVFIVFVYLRLKRLERPIRGSR